MTRTLLAAAFVALLSTGAMAQQPPSRTDDPSTYGFQPGDWQFNLSGTGTSNRDFERNNFGASAGLSYFLDKNIEFGARQDIVGADTGRDSAWNGVTRLGGWYNFDLGRWKPYAGASLGYIYGDSVAESGIVGPEAGVKYFLNSTTFIYGQTAYQWLFDRDRKDIDNNYDQAIWNHNVGLGLRF